MRRLTQEEFISKANKVHNNKYDYSLVRYTRGVDMIPIVCPTHGVFEQVASSHLSGDGCPKCKAEKIRAIKRKGQEQFIIDAKQVHGDKYSYENVVYITSKDKVNITCPTHGSFWQTPNSHLRGNGCPLCANQCIGERCRMSLEEFLSKAKRVHGDYYDYSLITNDNFTPNKKVPIKCPIHGVFQQTYRDHLSGRGCYKCGKASMAKKQALTRDEVVARANIIFKDKYDYSLFTEYQNERKKIKVICPRHGVFEVAIKNHLYNESGCPKCKRSFGEEKISTFLNEKAIPYEEQYRIPNEFLFCNNNNLLVDFYLPKHKTIIEFNGIQHYKESPLFVERTFEQQQERDESLVRYCKEHNIRLIVISYKEYDKINEILARYFA